MPRPFRTPGAFVWLAAAACCAGLGPAGLHVALAAAAGTLFEAAPFVLVAEALPAGRWRALGACAGCGCGGAVPGALSLAAAGLCWLAFGPLVTIVRTLAAVAVWRLRRRAPAGGAESDDAFAVLLALAPCAAAAALANSALAGVPPAFARSGAGAIASLTAGLVLGFIAPCGTAAVALAAAFAPHLPFATAGLLTTGGLLPVAALRTVRLPLIFSRVPAAATEPAAAVPALAGLATRRAYWARAGLLLALAIFVFGREPGFVNPRLTPFVWLGTLVAAAGVRRSSSTPAAIAVPGVMLLGLACGSPLPSFQADATRLDDAFAGERLAFTGVAHRHGAATVVVRFAITCCRTDASPVSVQTVARLPVADGTWVTMSGALQESGAGLVLQPASWRAISRPADPFVYR